MKRGKAPNARQKRWHDAVAQLPCMSCGATPVHVHHCVGSSAKHNKVHIGQDWVIPLCYDCHQGPGGVHGDMGRVQTFFHGGIGRKEFEKMAFDRTYSNVFFEIAPNDAPELHVYEAIMDYHK